MFQAPSPARLRVPVRTGKRSATEGSEITEFEHAGQERGHVPSAAPARLRVPVRTGKRSATEGSEIVEIQNAGAERGHDADSVVPTGLDLGATLIPGLKPGAIFFRPCGTEFAPGATTCPRSDRMGSHGGLPLRGIRWAAPARLRVPVRTGWAATGGLPLQGEADGQSRMRRYCAPILSALKGRPGIARGKSRGTRDAAPGNAPPQSKRPERAARAKRLGSNTEPVPGHLRPPRGRCRRT